MAEVPHGRGLGRSVAVRPADRAIGVAKDRGVLALSRPPPPITAPGGGSVGGSIAAGRAAYNEGAPCPAPAPRSTTPRPLEQWPGASSFPPPHAGMPCATRDRSNRSSSSAS